MSICGKPCRFVERIEIALPAIAKQHYQAALYAGKAVGFSLAGIGGVMIVNGQPGLMLVLTGLFIALNAKAEMLATDMAERLSGTRVRDLTWFGVAQATTDTDADTMWRRRRYWAGGTGRSVAS